MFCSLQVCIACVACLRVETGLKLEKLLALKIKIRMSGCYQYEIILYRSRVMRKFRDDNEHFKTFIKIFNTLENVQYHIKVLFANYI